MRRFSNQDIMKYAVINGVRTDVLFTNGGFISSDIPVRVSVGAGEDILTIAALRVFRPRRAVYGYIICF